MGKIKNANQSGATDGQALVYQASTGLWVPGSVSGGMPIYNVLPSLVSTTTSTGAANRALFFRVWQGGTISKIAVDISVSSGNICVGAYRGTAGRSNVMDRIATSGSVASPGTGYREISLGGSVTVLPGDWLAVAASDTTIRFQAASSTSAITEIATGFSTFSDNCMPLTQAGGSGGGGVRVPLVLLIGVP